LAPPPALKANVAVPPADFVPADPAADVVELPLLQPATVIAAAITTAIPAIRVVNRQRLMVYQFGYMACLGSR
jgi:hypothetical protein